jgi:hypothetical protein
MKAALLRCVLLALLVGTVATRIHRYLDTPADERAVVVKVLERQGLTLLDHFSPFRRPWLFFSVPGCNGVIQVVSISISLQEVPLVEPSLEPGDNRSYLYFGRMWSDPGVLSIRMEWIRLTVHALFSGRRPALMKTVLLVITPAGCQSLDAIDWRPIWDEA